VVKSSNDKQEATSMNNSTNGRRRALLRSTTVSATAVAAVLALAGPAHASNILHPEWVDGCDGCPGPVAFGVSVQKVYPERVLHAAELALAKGVTYRLNARKAKDPAVARRLTLESNQAFASMTSMLGSVAVGSGDDPGEWLCPDWWKGRIPPPKQGDFEKPLTDGLTTLGLSQLTSDPRAAAVLAADAYKSLDAAADIGAGCVG
jgi:hypothetical protein